jgi:hypothetical protein
MNGDLSVLIPESGDADHWDLAIIREEYLGQIPVSGFTRLDNVGNYWIIKSQSDQADGL